MVRAAESRGYPTADLLEDVGLTRALLDDPDARLDGAVVMRLWEALRERTADPGLQLSAPLALPFGAYRVIDYLVAASATVGDGVRRFSRFFGLVADAVVLTIDELPGEHRLHLGTADAGAVPPVYVDYIFAALVRRIRMRIRPDLRVLRVELRRPEPLDPVPYQEAFLAPVRFGRASDALHFDDDEWSSTTVDADEALARLLEEHARILENRIPHPRSAFRTEVEQAIASSLPDRPSVARIARALHVSVRTLQRRMEADGTTFRDVVEAVNERLAVSYLRDPNVSIAEVAFLLGFSDPSAFNRAFRRWTGDTPGKWREAHPGMR
ncbi:MAG: AraC family transcriptional regulator [Gemmatimonadota bacterium]|jgi:AraC-like DNA-binding protein